ncbi:putative two-component histidine kinase [Streptomyces sp. NBRC 110611]|uniref:sensor histidine kinase n=1 Tax=Streptomyces sp. NBRC 110611 TaxID=1621259 RepID=UPI00082AB4C3|nr:ATP-binding protein [Streptomyces sp. NBRC 110611]GAU66716.1 putative two-component histidine kinase [Streptomyces sp. NBRC 110611]
MGGSTARTVLGRLQTLGLARALCLGLIALGTATYATEFFELEPLPYRTVAAMAVVSAIGGLVLPLGTAPQVRWLLVLVSGSFTVVALSPRLSARVGHLILAFLLAGALCSVVVWSRPKTRLEREKLQALIVGQEHYATLMAGELHDEVLQLLALTRRQLDAARAKEDPHAWYEAVDLAVRRLDEQEAVLRGVIASLHPVALRGTGLTATVRSLADRVAADSGLTVRVHVQGDTLDEPKPDDGVAQTAYRIVQESLSNVVKHADAGHTRVTLAYRRGYVGVTVADDGRGIPRNSRLIESGYGIPGMHWRCEAYGGTLSVLSPGTGLGTVVRAVLPREPRRPEAPGQPPQARKKLL